MVFQFTHPVRGATQAALLQYTHCVVSIHAPREGCDHPGQGVYRSSYKFQFTHPVRGATTSPPSRSLNSREFQFTHPVRGATGQTRAVTPDSSVSIHAPREGCDVQGFIALAVIKRFNSRTP